MKLKRDIMSVGETLKGILTVAKKTIMTIFLGSIALATIPSFGLLVGVFCTAFIGFIIYRMWSKK